MKSKSKRSEW
jgi:hypothetical protein